MNANNLIVSQIRQRLEILYQMVEELETSGGGDTYTKAQIDSKIAHVIWEGTEAQYDALTSDDYELYIVY